MPREPRRASSPLEEPLSPKQRKTLKAFGGPAEAQKWTVDLNATPRRLANLMSDVKRTPVGPVGVGAVRLTWLKAMYVLNLIIALPLGLVGLVAPGPLQGMMGLPPGDPIHFGIAAGAIPFAFGLAGAVGLRFPLVIAPVLALQALYKSVFLVGVALPLLIRGQFPEFAVGLCLVYTLFIIGNVIAVPFSSLFSRRVQER